MVRSFRTLAIFSLFLTACSSKPVSYLPTVSEPIVNIEADIASQIELKTESEQFLITNLTTVPQNIAYKLFWYDKDGVTQTFNQMSESSVWQNVWLQPNQKQSVALVKATEESTNYRLYLRKAEYK